MDIFGIGPTELVFIFLIALILLGPKDMEKTGRTIGRFLRNMTRSDGWRAFRDTSREIRNLPNRLMREANLEDLDKELGKIGKEIEDTTKDVKGFGTWVNPAAGKSKPPQSSPVPTEEKKTPDTSPEVSPPPPVKETNTEPGNDG